MNIGALLFCEEGSLANRAFGEMQHMLSQHIAKDAIRNRLHQARIRDDDQFWLILAAELEHRNFHVDDLQKNKQSRIRIRRMNK